MVSIEDEVNISQLVVIFFREMGEKILKLKMGEDSCNMIAAFNIIQQLTFDNINVKFTLLLLLLLLLLSYQDLLSTQYTL